MLATSSAPAVTSDAERLVTEVIDDLAITEPNWVCCSLPVNNADFSLGFQDITIAEFADAVDNAAVWIDRAASTAVDGSSCTSFAYFGDRDFRQPILICGAAKTGRHYQFISPWTSESAKLALLDATGCKVFVYSKQYGSLAAALANARPGIKFVECPDMLSFLQPCPTGRYSSKIDWNTAQDQPFVVFHTSGTTGNPKPLSWSHKAFRACERLKKLDNFEKIKWSNFRRKRYFFPLACAHGLGIVSLLNIAISMRATMVIGATDRLVDESDLRDIFKYGRIQGYFGTPAYIKTMTDHPDLLDRLRSLDFVYYGGAKADKQLGDKLWRYTSVGPIFGSTETGNLPLEVVNGENWQWYKFLDYGGISFESVGEDIYEMVFNRLWDGTWQQCFSTFPHLDQWRTRDLFTRHPDHPDLYAYYGRTDETVMLSCGDGVHAPSLEEKLEQCSGVSMAMIGGAQKDDVWLLLELKPPVKDCLDQRWVSELIRILEEINSAVSSVGRILANRIIIAAPDRPLARTAKQALDRKRTLALYADEITALDHA